MPPLISYTSVRVTMKMHAAQINTIVRVDFAFQVNFCMEIFSFLYSNNVQVIVLVFVFHTHAAQMNSIVTDSVVLKVNFCMEIFVFLY